MLKHLQEILVEEKVFYTSSRVCDDIDAVNSAECCGFSYCLPTKDLIHSYKNKARVDSLNGYYNSLRRILTELLINENINKTFSSWNFKAALKAKDLKAFSKAIKAKTTYPDRSKWVVDMTEEESDNELPGKIKRKLTEVSSKYAFSHFEKIRLYSFFEYLLENDYSVDYKSFAIGVLNNRTSEDLVAKGILSYMKNIELLEDNELSGYNIVKKKEKELTKAQRKDRTAYTKWLAEFLNMQYQIEDLVSISFFNKHILNITAFKVAEAAEGLYISKEKAKEILEYMYDTGAIGMKGKKYRFFKSEEINWE